jgi:hypothetical protein
MPTARVHAIRPKYSDHYTDPNVWLGSIQWCMGSMAIIMRSMELPAATLLPFFLLLIFEPPKPALLLLPPPSCDTTFEIGVDA